MPSFSKAQTLREFSFKAGAKLLRLAGATANDAACFLEQHPWLTRREKSILARNRLWQNKYRGRRGFVVGNGPSLNKMQLAALKSELVFVLNGFACHPILDLWQPVALCLADPLYFDRHELLLGEFDLMRKRLPGASFFLPLAAYEASRKHSLLPPDRSFFCCQRGSMALQRAFNVDLTRAVPGVQNVALLAITVSLYMGCNPVYLIGMDHDFLASPKTPTYFSNDYNSRASSQAKAYGIDNWDYLSVIKAVERIFAGYVNINRSAQKRGQSIMNASVGGYLDVFPRVAFDSLF